MTKFLGNCIKANKHSLIQSYFLFYQLRAHHSHYILQGVAIWISTVSHCFSKELTIRTYVSAHILLYLCFKVIMWPKPQIHTHIYLHIHSHICIFELQLCLNSFIWFARHLKTEAGATGKCLVCCSTYDSFFRVIN